MRTIFNFGLLLLLLFIFFRLTHIRKEKLQLKTAIVREFDEDKARHYRYLTIFQLLMHGGWVSIGLYYIYYFFLK
ncbi:MAG: hypothetical protein H6573_03060 [Lewinellaceae bacterium]|nr:hypothetical protein [Phaeodactylibacter sp.]MCB0613772.1 hypothetical protein [Phaeodactylibacter sp.]MCB9346473.1 hypothetical protein [Lewinellaceae bacterium]